MTLKLNGSSSGYTAIDAPAAAGSNTLVLPADNGSNGEFLKTNGSGTLDWSVAGKILQVVSSTKTTASDTGGNLAQNTDWDTGLSVAITPSAASSKILLTGHAVVYGHAGGMQIGLRIYSNSGGSNAVITAAQSSDAGSRVAFHSMSSDQWDNGGHSIAINWLDSPNTTSAVTYKIYAAHTATNEWLSINRSKTDADNATYARCTSTLNAWEVGA